MAALAWMMAIGGLCALVIGKQWIDPSNLRPASPPFGEAGTDERAVPPTSVADRLRTIDWFQFEAVAARILESDGWVVQKSGGANPDGGADLVALRRRPCRRNLGSDNAPHRQRRRVFDQNLPAKLVLHLPDGAVAPNADDGVLFRKAVCFEIGANVVID